MSETVTRLFASAADAKKAVAELEHIGVPYAEISIISSTADGRRLAGPGEHLGDHDPIIDEEAKKGAEGGATVGAGLGILAGLPLLAIPGLGPVFAAGWLAATLGTAVGGAAIGTAAGGLVATLTHHGVDEADAHTISEAVRRGETLVSARVDDAKVAEANAIMYRQNAVDASTRGEAYRSCGWTGVYSDGPPRPLPHSAGSAQPPTV
jgi:hypothetical protein